MFRGRDKRNIIPSYKDEKPGNSADRLRPRYNVSGLFKFDFLSSIDPKAVLVLSLGWLIVVHFNERSYPYWTIKRCDWHKWETWKSGSPHRVLIVADPQIVDDYSYPDRPRLINFIVRQMSDNYHYRNYKLLQYYLDSDSTIFLGDLFDGGREWNYKSWFKELQRFSRIFTRIPNRRTILSLPGNHDIGFESISTERAKRFACHFGPPNDFIELGNHTVVLLDVISLSSEDPKINQASNEFLQEFDSMINPKFPRVLFQHVPLYRDNTKQVCGKHRESPKPFPVQKGLQYQTVIESALSTTILSTIKPSIVFTGDDHDYCDIQHSYSPAEQPAREITVKSCAMTGGITYPAVQLLSLNNPVDSLSNPLSSDPSYETEMCYLPSPYFILSIYVSWSILSVLGSAVYFIFPKVRLQIAAIKDKLDDKNILPSFASNTKTVTLEKNIPGFLINTSLSFLIAFIIISIYYHYV